MRDESSVAVGQQTHRTVPSLTVEYSLRYLEGGREGGREGERGRERGRQRRREA